MRNSLQLFSLLTTLHTLSASSQGFSPFQQHGDFAFDYLEQRDTTLQRRQNSNCANNGISCSSLGAASVCCPSDTICATDSQGNVGCCPVGAACTGIIPGGSQVTGSGSVSGSSATQSATQTGATQTTAFVLGGSTQSTTGVQTNTGGGSLAIPTTGVQGGGGTIAAAGFVFTYIPTSYANAAICTTAYSVCQQQSSACFASLGGGAVNGVTVGGLGGGTTVVGNGGGGGGATVTNAASVCSSLSSQACYGLQQDVCTSFGTGGGGGGGATAVVTSAGGGPQRTACPGALYAAGAGVVVGAMRGFV